MAMSMIFPGMDPYLENPQVWPGVHASFIVYLRDFLQPQLQPRCVAFIEERVYMEGPEREVIPHVGLRRTSRPTFSSPGIAVADTVTPIRVRVPSLQVTENYVTIRHRESGRRIVTIIEVVSPTNKYAGPGRNSFLAKQQQVLESDANLVEIDLLRHGPHVLTVPEFAARAQGPYDYMVCINRSGGIREDYDLIPLALRMRLPKIRVPLAENDPEVVLDLQAVLERVYEAGSYRGELRYDAACVPRLSPENQEWANACIRQAGEASAQQAPPSA
jgi:hypothetical protein